LVLASQYRNDDEFGGSDINDVINLIDLADDFDFCDSDKLGMEGWSRGGMMTYLALTLTDKIRCAVIISGIADLQRNSKSINIFSNKLLEKINSKDEIKVNEQLIKRSAVHFVNNISKNTSVLLIHGTNDKKVSYLDSKEMYEKLRFYNQKGKYELKLINGGDHYLKDSKKEISLMRKNWYDSFLKL
jgi:dipeptidyl aminopeptidase/acylaminoacyl peptidase